MTRGAHLLEAALTILAEQGPAALSVRTVAAAAGVSPAQVQYYYRTKNDLVRAGYDYAGEQFLAELAESDTLADMVRRWLPLDAHRERRARVWLAYASTAAVDPVLAKESAAQDRELRENFAERVGDRAAQLLAMIDGVTIQCLTLPMKERQALVDRTLTPFLDGAKL